MSGRTRCAVLLTGLVALSGALAPAPPASTDPVKSIAEAQLKLIQQALTDLERLRQLGEAGVTNPNLALWERRKVEAIRGFGVSRTDFITALEAYRNKMKSFEHGTQLAYQQGQATRVDYYDAQYRRMEADIWLNQEKSK